MNVATLLLLAGLFHPLSASGLPSATLGAAVASAPVGDCVVYVTGSGTRYHRAQCKSLVRHQNVRRMTLREARSRGLSPCHVCGGSDCDESEPGRSAPTSQYGGKGASGCPPEGDAVGGHERTLNRRKNRDLPPGPGQIDPVCTFSAMTMPGNDRARWTESRGATVEAWVVDVYAGPVESCNCHASEPDDMDTHVALASNPGENRSWRWVVAEVTPTWRRIMRSRGRDWTTAGLRRLWLGKKVRITGWLLLDDEHLHDARNTARKRAYGRATAWELHPITEILPAQ